MKRAKRIEAVLCFLVIGALIGYGLFVLRDLREIGPIEHSTGSSLLISPVMADLVLYGPGDWLVYYIAGRAIGWAWDHWNDPNATRNTGPGGLETDGCGPSTCPAAPFGGGGGGGW